MDYLDAKEPRDIAKEKFIGEGKPHWHLKDCNIMWLYQDKGRMKNGYAVTRVAKLWHHVTGFDVVIKILVETWDHYKADQNEAAFVDHMLSHIELTEKEAYKINHPPVQEFIEVINRHGAWRQPVTDMVETPSLRKSGG